MVWAMPDDGRRERDHREVFAFGTDYLVFVDDAYRDDGALKVLLEQYEGTATHAEPTCRSEEELRQALVEMGARDDQAKTTAALLWARHMGPGSET